MEVSNEQVFSEVYHSLIHSEALETLLNLEHTYAIAVEDVISQRDRDIEHLEDKYVSTSFPSYHYPSLSHHSSLVMMDFRGPGEKSIKYRDVHLIGGPS